MSKRPSSGPSTFRVCALAILPMLVAASPARSERQTKAYVTHGGAGLVTVIDTATGTVAATIPVGAGPADVVVSRDDSRAYVTNSNSNSVSVIDIATDAVTDTIPVGDGPSSLAVTPDGRTLYVMTAAGAVEVVDATLPAVVATIPVGATGDLAITPDGRRLYVAAGLVHIIDTATHVVVRSFAAETSSIEGISNSASTVALSPDGTTAYVGVVTFNTTGGNFGAGGSVLRVDTSSEEVAGTIPLFSLPGSIAFTPDGSRAYVGIQSTFVNTGYGMGFFPGRHLYVIDTVTSAIAGVVDFGADGPNWTQQNTASGIGVTADRRSVYAGISRLGVVAVADVNTNSVTARISVATSPGAVAVVPNGDVTLVPYVVDAADDTATGTSAGGTALASVLANDRIGGLRADLAHVTLAQQSSTSEGVTVDPATGAVEVAAGTALGVHTVAYRICEIASPSNCDDGTVTVTVRTRFVIDAVNDSGSTTPGWTAVANVVANDTLDGAPAAGRVTLWAVSSTSAGVTLNVPYGAVSVAPGTAAGPQTLTYRICEIADPANCDTADVAVTVVAFAIDAVSDAGSAPRSGGIAVANVLANDTFAGGAAAGRVSLAQLASSNAGVALSAASGRVTVLGGTPVGTYTVSYRICEIAAPSNCDDATVTVTVLPLAITASTDTARGSSKRANTALPSVLTNDRLNGALATVANVRLSFVSLTPANSMIKLDVTDGSVDVLGKTSSGLYSLLYQICESAMPDNCARGTVSIDLSGGL